MQKFATGYLMIDIAGTELTAEDKALLQHPLVGGIILFSRNYENIAQLKNLTQAIHQLRTPALCIMVDHEGGRVQRFRHGFTAIPPMRTLGDLYDQHPEKALIQAEQLGLTIGQELRACGIDGTFAPVVDVDTAMSEVIGDRAFHTNPPIIGLLAARFIQGLHHTECLAVAKHFPGHGHVSADSHHEIPIDNRPLNAIHDSDLIPYSSVIAAGVDGIMPAHVIYSTVDTQPAGFSAYWLQTILRHQLNFKGTIFSDDLCMEGASVAGDILARVAQAKQAGCDMLLICNHRSNVIRVINHANS